MIGLRYYNLIKVNSSLLKFSFCNYKFSNSSFQTDAVKKLKFQPKYIQNENNYAHNMLLHLPDYNQTTIDVQKIVMEYKNQKDNESINTKHHKKHKSKVMSNQDRSRNFSELIKSIKEFEKLKSPVLSEIIIYLSQDNQLTDSELIELLLNLVNRTSFFNNSKENYELFNLLSKESIQKSRKWNKDQILLLADIWYAMNIPTSSKYHSHAITMLYTNPMSLSSHQIIQSFFYINLLRQHDFHIQQPVIEQKIEEFIQHVTIQEVSIIAMGFFKTQNIIKSIALLRTMVELLVINKKIVSDFPLCSILKLLRQSFDGTHPDHAQLCSTINGEFRSEVEHLNYYSLTLLASIGNHVNLYDEPLLSQIIEAFVAKFSSLRLKDLERISFIVMNSGISASNPKFCELVERELLKPSRSEEKQYYFSSFLSCTYYLACMEHYNSSLISEVLRLNDISKASGAQKALIMKYTRLNHLYELDMMIQIEGPQNYEGYRLNKDYSKSLMKKYSPRIPSSTSPNLTSQERKFMMFKEVMLKMMTNDFMAVEIVLPNSSAPQILFCTNRVGNLKPFPHSTFDTEGDCVKSIPNSHKHLNWFAVMLVSPKYYIHGTNNLRGSVLFRIRLLQKLGYKVIAIPSGETSVEEMRIRVLKCLQNSVNEENLRKLQINYKYQKRKSV